MRWIVAAAGTALMAVLGAVYSWSLYAQPLAAAFGWSASTTSRPFAAAIFFLGAGAILGGRLQDRLGPRAVALAGAALWAAGNLLAGLGTARLGAPWLVATYGVVGGLGLGLAYVTPVAAVTKWFPGRRGLGSGLVVMGFGLGAFLYNLVLRTLGPIAGADAIGARFAGSGLVFAVLGLGAAALLRNPPPPAASATAGSTPGSAAATATGAPTPGATASSASTLAPGAAPAAASAAAPADWPPAAALRTPQFWALWAMLFLNVTAGILFISSAVPLLRELTGASSETATAVYALIALANGAGRLFWGAISDRLGRRAAFALIYGAQIGVFALVGGLHALAPVAALFALVLLCYGGGFGTMPSLVADWFGTRHLGVNYGWILSAWGAAGVAGPTFAALVKDATGSYAGALPVMAGVLSVALILPVVARRPSRWEPGVAAAGPAPPANGA